MPLPDITPDDLTYTLAVLLREDGDLEDYRDLRRCLTVLPPDEVRTAVLAAVNDQVVAILAQFD